MTALGDRSVTLKTAWPAACIPQNGVAGPDSHFWRDRSITLKTAFPARDAPGAKSRSARRGIRISSRQKRRGRPIRAEDGQVTPGGAGDSVGQKRRGWRGRILAAAIFADARRVTARRITARRDSARSQPRRECRWTPAPNATCGDPACPMATSA